MQELAAHDPVSRVSPLALSRQSLAWAALAAFLGSAVGLAGTFASSPWAVWGGPRAGLLAASSLLGVASLLGRGSWAARVGVALLLVWLAASLGFVLYSSLWRPEPGPSFTPPFALSVLLHASAWGGSAAVLPFTSAPSSGARRYRLGAVLLVLSVPGFLLVLLYANSIGAETISLGQIEALVVLSSPAAGVGVPEAVLWMSVGTILFGEARGRALGKARRGWPSRTATRPSDSTRRVSGGATPRRWTRWFLRTSATSGAAIAASKGWSVSSRSYGRRTPTSRSRRGPGDRGDLVRTQLTISGTDRGSGVMWYPPTGRHVSLEAEFVDRFSGGLLVEHAGRADTEGLLRQLGHHGEV